MRSLRSSRLRAHRGRHAVGGEHHEGALRAPRRSRRRRSRRAPRASPRRAGCARSACARRPGRRASPAPARRPRRPGRRRRSSRAAWPAGRACCGRDQGGHASSATGRPSRGRLAVRCDPRHGRIAEESGMTGGMKPPCRCRCGSPRAWSRPPSSRPATCPASLAELPVTAVSQALQASMRVQQKVTELAIKGDRALGVLRPRRGEAGWATFDDDLRRRLRHRPDRCRHRGVHRRARARRHGSTTVRPRPHPDRRARRITPAPVDRAGGPPRRGGRPRRGRGRRGARAHRRRGGRRGRRGRGDAAAGPVGAARLPRR